MRSSLRQRRIILAACATLLLLGGAGSRAHAFYERNAPDAVWYADAKMSMVQVAENNLVLAIPTIQTQGSQNEVTLDFKVKPAYQASIGRASESGDLRLSYFTYKHDASVDVNGPRLDYLVTFGNFNNSNFNYAQVIGTMELETHQIDLDFSRTLLKEAGTEISWLLGLRAWMLNQRLTAIAIDGPSAQSDVDTTYSDSRAAGFTAGLRGRARLASWVSAHAGVTSAFLTGRQDTQDNDVACNGAACLTTRIAANGHAKNFLQTDFGAYLDFGPWRGASVFLGYEFRRYNDAVGSIGFPFPGVANQSLVSHAVTFSGLQGGLSYRF